MKWLKTRSEIATENKPAHALWFTRSLLQRALRVGGCVICAALRISERRSIHSFLYEGMMSPMVRRQFLDGGGFCLRHFWLAKEIEDECWPAGGVGMAMLCEDLVRETASHIQHLDANNSPAPRPRQSNTNVVLPDYNCVFCAELREKQDGLIKALEQVAGEEEFATRLTPDRLCAFHMQVAIAGWQDSHKRSWIARLAEQQLSVLAEDLREFIRKHDHQHRQEASGHEHDVVVRAIAFLAGGNPGPEKSKRRKQ
jgi:hypothetical protein